MPRSPYPNNAQLLHQPTCYMCLFCAPYQMGKEGYVSFTQLNTTTHSLFLPEVWLKCKSLCCPSLYISLGHKHLLSFHSPKKITASNKTFFFFWVNFTQVWQSSRQAPFLYFQWTEKWQWHPITYHPSAFAGQDHLKEHYISRLITSVICFLGEIKTKWLPWIPCFRDSSVRNMKRTHFPRLTPDNNHCRKQI